MRSAELQTAVYEALNAHAPLMALIHAVYDDVPHEAEFPYVVIGEAVSTPADTDDSVGASHLIDVHTWSRYEGVLETKNVQGEVYAALHRATFSVENAYFVGCDLEHDEVFPPEPDGITRHGVQRFRVILDEVL